VPLVVYCAAVCYWSAESGVLVCSWCCLVYRFGIGVSVQLVVYFVAVFYWSADSGVLFCSWCCIV
jgi:hypothetical protein